jgi:hypothetical protein
MEEKNKLKRDLTDEELDVFFRTNEEIDVFFHTNYTFQNYPKGNFITSYSQTIQHRVSLQHLNAKRSTAPCLQDIQTLPKPENLNPVP